MATTIVELSGDEAKLLRTFRNVLKNQEEVEGKFSEIAGASATASDQVGQNMEQAATASAKDFDQVVRQLRKLGPEGRKVASEVESHLQASGKGGRQSMETVIDKLRELDPEAAETAAAMRRHLVESANAVDVEFVEVGATGEKTFGAGLVTKLGAAAAGFFSVGEAVQLVNQSLKDQEELLDNALEGHLALAAAQQEASKNLGGFTPAQRAEFLQETVPEIAVSTGFTDLRQITDAGGVAASRGAAYDDIDEVVSAAARIERLTPENLDETTSGAVAIQRQTGLEDPRQAIALLQTTGTQAAITDVAALVKSMPGAVGATMSTVRNQDIQEASRQSAALFAQITQGGNDERGDSSSNFQIDLSNRMGSFFAELESQRINARSELQALQKKGDPVEKDVVRMQELKQLIPELENLQDPGTLFGRIEALQRSSVVRDEFVGEGFGEQRFRVVLDDLFDATSKTAKGLRDSFDIIQADASFYEREVKAMESGTPQLELATATSRSEAGRNAQRAFDTSAATLASVRETASQALAETNPGGIRGMLATGFTVPGLGIPVGDVGIMRGTLPGTDAIGEGLSAIERLSERRDSLVAGGVDESEQLKLGTIDSAIQSITELLVSRIEAGAFETEVLARMSRSARGAANQAEDSLHQYMTPELVEEQRETRRVLERLAETMERQIAASQETAPTRGPQRQPATEAALAGARAQIVN